MDLIVAISASKMIIGNKGTLPWHIPEDLKFFKMITLNKTVIMGKNTWLSLPKKPLPGRKNVVISKTLEDPSVEIFNSLSKARDNHPDAFVIGGRKIYEESLRSNMIKRMYITWVDGEVQGDVVFPYFSTKNWLKTSLGKGRNEKYSYEFTRYDLVKEI